MKPKKVMLVFGTRPEAIKMAPVIAEMRRHPDRIHPVVTVTGQHREMLEQVLTLFRITPDHDLEVMKANQTLEDVTCAVLTKLGPLLESERPDLLLVQGDTTTAFAAALSGFYRHVPVGHIEAGLRTYDKDFPFPEEINRVLATHLSTVHFAPTEQAKRNLLRERVAEDAVLVTGNTVIDALLSVTREAEPDGDHLSNGARRILVTAHRRESWGQPLVDICNAILTVVRNDERIQVVFPVHLNPKVRNTVHEMLGDQERIHLMDPLGYRDFALEIARADLILTDSGGIQEEAPSLKKPVLVLRNETERQEGVDAGTCRLVGTDPQRIIEEVTRLFADRTEYDRMAQAANPYGDGRASERIVSHILENF